MAGRPWSATTRLFSSASSSESDTSSGLWANSTKRGTRRRRAGGADKAIVDDDDPFFSGSAFDGSGRSPASAPSLKRALQASRVRASAALAKASRLQEETVRLRAALKVSQKEAERADKLEDDVATRELRVRELEYDKRQLLRGLDEVKARTRQCESQTHASVSALRATLKDLEDGQRARCRRWAETTRTLRALLESLRRHVQRGQHSAPTFTAFQLIEQLFRCLEKQEEQARPPPPSAKGRPRSAETTTRRDRDSLSAAEAAAAAAATSNATIAELRDENKRLRKKLVRNTLDAESSTSAPPHSAPSLPPRPAAAAAARERWASEGGGSDPSGVRFPTEMAYRLAVTKLTAQLKAARERLRAEKDAAERSEERATKDGLRCRQLEIDVDALSARLKNAEAHSERLGKVIKETREERDSLKRKQHSAATKALRAALGIAHQHQQQQQRQRSARTTSGTAQDGGAAVYRDSESVFDRDRVDDDPGKTTGRRAAAAEEERYEPVHIETGRRSSVQDGPVRSEANRTGPGRTRADRTEDHPGGDRGPAARVSSTRTSQQRRDSIGKRRSGDIENERFRLGVSGGTKRNAASSRYSRARISTSERARDSSAGTTRAGEGASGGRGGRTWDLGPRAVTEEDLAKLDDEIAQLSTTVEQAALAQTRRILQNVAASVERQADRGYGSGDVYRARE